jgi:hypothetical protein
MQGGRAEKRIEVVSFKGFSTRLKKRKLVRADETEETDLLGNIPSLTVPPRAWKAPVDKSIDDGFLHVGHSYEIGSMSVK